MPIYEYYCEKCDKVFESLRAIKNADEPAPCPACGREADRIMPTEFSSMVLKGGWRQRAPFHQSGVRTEGAEKRTVARVKPKGSVKPSAPSKRKASGGKRG